MITIQQTFFQQKIPVIQISNQTIDLSISIDFGPRILFFGFTGGPNHFFVRQNDLQNFKQSLQSFNFFGGHRLWAAPEDPILTYIPDNQPVAWKQDGTALILNQVLESPQLKIGKQISIQIDPILAMVKLTHRITNLGDQPVHFAPWAISQMAPGGVAVVPLPPRGSHIGNLLPTSSLVLWPYTDLSDPRWRFGYEFIRVQQDMTITKPLKFGLAAKEGWLAYFNHSQLFHKQIQVRENAVYPDLGTPLQVFLDGDFLELETMGPLAWIQPGQTSEHQETWRLFANCPPARNDQQINDILRNQVF